jgi:hypothetical protein
MIVEFLEGPVLELIGGDVVLVDGARLPPQGIVKAIKEGFPLIVVRLFKQFVNYQFKTSLWLIGTGSQLKASGKTFIVFTINKGDLGIQGRFELGQAK